VFNAFISKIEDKSADNLFSSQVFANHIRQSSQVNNPHMRNLDRILSQSRSNSRGNLLKRKSSLRGIKNKSKVAKLQMSYISPLSESREASIK